MILQILGLGGSNKLGRIQLGCSLGSHFQQRLTFRDQSHAHLNSQGTQFFLHIDYPLVFYLVPLFLMRTKLRTQQRQHYFQYSVNHDFHHER